MTLRIIAAGGTFDKHYNELAGQLTFAQTHLNEVIERARFNAPVILETLPLMDSLDMQHEDRVRIVNACRQSPESHIVIIHGTDTMQDTAAVLGAAHIDKTIVITGAMIPYSIVNSDALFNFGFACGVAGTLSHGVYVAMNGHVFTWDNVVKNRKIGQFTTREGLS